MKKVSRIFTMIVSLLILLSVISIIPAFSEEAYKFELMWPPLLWNFHFPHGVAVDSTGNVYVAEGSSGGFDCIQKFGSNGNLIAKWGSICGGEGQFWASSMALDSSGNVYVADGSNSRIQKFDANGKFITQWGSYGTGDGQFNDARGIAVDSSGSVYVTDPGNNRIQKFDSNGNFIIKFDSGGINVAVDSLRNIYVVSGNSIQKFDSNGNFITKWGSQGSGNSQFNEPWGVAVDSPGNVYVVDTSNHRIQKFDSNGNFITKWGSEGVGDGRFQYPSRVAVDSVGYVYIVDWYRIQKFDSNGKFITQLSPYGAENGRFNNPGEVSTDSSGNTYVLDTDNCRIQKFNSNGNFITKWGSAGSGNAQFGCFEDEFGRIYGGLTGISVDSSGNVYVADTYNHRIQKFDLSGNFITKWGSWGTGSGQFISPTVVAADSSGNVYVFELGNPVNQGNSERIQKFDSNGNFIAKWSMEKWYEVTDMAVDSAGNVYVSELSSLEKPNQLKNLDSNGRFITKWAFTNEGLLYPGEVAVDSSGFVYVADAYVFDKRNARIYKFDSNGILITEWGFEGTGLELFTNAPSGITVDLAGNVFVADSFNHRIVKFKPVGQDKISTPRTPIGPADATVEGSYRYSVEGSTSDYGHPIEYRFFWGDGTYSNWSSSPSDSKSWATGGTYVVKAQARCAIEPVKVSNWSLDLRVDVSASITLQSPSKNSRFTISSLYSPPAFSWNATEDFKSYEIQFSEDQSFDSLPVKVKVPGTTTETVIKSSTWKKVLLISGENGGNVYWRVVGTKANGRTVASFCSFIIEPPEPVENAAISPTSKDSLPTLTWRNNGNTKFKVWFFGADWFHGTDLEKRLTNKSYTFNSKNPADEGFSIRLTSDQWEATRKLILAYSEPTIYWKVESWDALGRPAVQI